MVKTLCFYLKAIGGVQVKKSMLGLSERSPWGRTEASYGMSKLIFVQKLSHFEVHDFGRISHKKTDKIDVLRYFTPNVSAPSIFVRIGWNLHQITTPYRELRRPFWKFWKLAILWHFCTKNGLKLGAPLKLCVCSTSTLNFVAYFRRRPSESLVWLIVKSLNVL